MTEIKREAQRQAPPQPEVKEILCESKGVTAGKEIPGRKNEDAYFADDRLGLYAVCDGVGGEAGGDVASSMAVDHLKKNGHLLNGLEGKPLADKMREILSAAGKSIRTAGERDKKLKGMLTTITLAKVSGGKLYVASVGDSRLYRKDKSGNVVCETLDSHHILEGIAAHEVMGRDEALLLQRVFDKISKPEWAHGLVIGAKDNRQIMRTDELVQHYGFDQEEAEYLQELEPEWFVNAVDIYFESRNVIEGALGDEGEVKVGVYPIDIEDGDEFLLTSDGIHDNLTANELALIWQGKFRELNDVKIEDALKGVTDLTEALVIAAKTRSFDQSSERRKVDDKTALRVLTKTKEKTAPIKEAPKTFIETPEAAVFKAFQEATQEQEAMTREFNALMLAAPTKEAAEKIIRERSARILEAMKRAQKALSDLQAVKK